MDGEYRNVDSSQETNLKPTVTPSKRRMPWGILILAALAAVWLVRNGMLGGSAAEQVARSYMRNYLAGNATKCAALTSEVTIAESGYATEKLFANDLQKRIDYNRSQYDNKYGKWSCTVAVVDSYPYTLSGDLTYAQGITDYAVRNKGQNVMVKIKIKGKGLFKKKSGEVDIMLLVVNENGKWKVLDCY